MLTINRTALQVELSDTTVSVLPGSVPLSETLMVFPGTRTTFSAMTHFDNTGYQNVLLYLYPSSTTTVDMTRSYSSVTQSQASVQNPVMDSSNGYPIGMFTFKKTDSTVTLVDTLIHG